MARIAVCVTAIAVCVAAIAVCVAAAIMSFEDIRFGGLGGLGWTLMALVMILELASGET